MRIIAGLKPYDLRIMDVNLEDTNKVGVAFSGGMDSTLLLYMMLKDKEQRNLNTEIHCFTASQCGTKLNSQIVLSQPEFAGKVIHHLDADNQTTEGIKPLMRWLLDAGWTVYGATNATPLEQIGGRYPIRAAKFPDGNNNHLPFLMMYKYHILDAYYQLGIDHLLKFTHTCTEQEVGDCGLCFACRERQWAFEKLGK